MADFLNDILQICLIRGLFLPLMRLGDLLKLRAVSRSVGHSVDDWMAGWKRLDLDSLVSASAAARATSFNPRGRLELILEILLWAQIRCPQVQRITGFHLIPTPQSSQLFRSLISFHALTTLDLEPLNRLLPPEEDLPVKLIELLWTLGPRLLILNLNRGDPDSLVDRATIRRLGQVWNRQFSRLFQRLTSLEELRVQGFYIPLHQVLSTVPNKDILRVLDVQNTYELETKSFRCSDEDCAALLGCPALKVLVLSASSVTDDILRGVGPQLTKLVLTGGNDIGHVWIAGQVHADFQLSARLTRLREFALESRWTNDLRARTLNFLPAQMTKLVFNVKSLPSHRWEQIFKLSNLEDLELIGLEVGHPLRLLTKLPRLRRLKLVFADAVSNSLRVYRLPSPTPNLSKLEVTFSHPNQRLELGPLMAKQLLSASFSVLSTKQFHLPSELLQSHAFANLAVLSMHQYSPFSEQFLCSIPSSCPVIRFLSLDFTNFYPRVPEVAMQNLKNCPRISQVEIRRLGFVQHVFDNWPIANQSFLGKLTRFWHSFME